MFKQYTYIYLNQNSLTDRLNDHKTSGTTEWIAMVSLPRIPKSLTCSLIYGFENSIGFESLYRVIYIQERFR